MLVSACCVGGGKEKKSSSKEKSGSKEKSSSSSGKSPKSDGALAPVRQPRQQRDDQPCLLHRDVVSLLRRVNHGWRALPLSRFQQLRADTTRFFARCEKSRRGRRRRAAGGEERRWSDWAEWTRSTRTRSVGCYSDEPEHVPHGTTGGGSPTKFSGPPPGLARSRRWPNSRGFLPNELHRSDQTGRIGLFADSVCMYSVTQHVCRKSGPRQWYALFWVQG